MPHCLTYSALNPLHPSLFLFVSMEMSLLLHVMLPVCPFLHLSTPPSVSALSVRPSVRPLTSNSKVRRLEEQLRSFDQSLKSLQASEDKVLMVANLCATVNQSRAQPPLPHLAWKLLSI